MVELHKEEKIVKGNDRYVHTTTVTYPPVNVRNMLKSWKETVEKQEEWLKDYDQHVKDAEKTAIESVEKQFEEMKKEVHQVLVMTDEEKFNHWNKLFLKQAEELNALEKKKDELIEEQKNQNLNILQRYKHAYEEDLRNKKEAIKKWTLT